MTSGDLATADASRAQRRRPLEDVSTPLFMNRTAIALAATVQLWSAIG